MERDKTKTNAHKPEGVLPMAVGWCASKVLQSALSLEVRDGDPCGSKDTRAVDVLETMEASENCHVGIRAFP